MLIVNVTAAAAGTDTFKEVQVTDTFKMVSQPDPMRALSLRGPSSVVSRSSRRGHHRSNRSHAGGSLYAPQNEFPVFSNTGDVEITISAGGRENKYLLHRLILVQNSGFFQTSTSEEWSRHDDGGAQSGQLARIGEGSSTSVLSAREPPRRWRYVLDKGTSPDDIPMLVQSKSLERTISSAPPPAVRNKPAASSASFFRSVANLSITPSHSSDQHPLSEADADLLRDYDNLFRIFYNYAPALDGVNIADAYMQCKSLVALADLYDALPVVGPRIDHHLLQFQGRLFKQIAKYPSSYLRLGYMARSKVIFAEALCHVVGQWPVGERHMRATLPTPVVELIEDKVDELTSSISFIESRLLRLSLLTRNGERVTPATGYIDWLAVSLFRSWFADQITPAPPSSKPAPLSRPGRNDGRRPSERERPAPPPQQSTDPFALPPHSNRGRVYRLIGTAPASYLTHDDVKTFLKLIPELYTRDNMRRLERKVEEMKGLAREAVSPLMGVELQGGSEGVRTEGMPYFLCTRVREEEWPWDE